jgi:hypothetical protein
MVRENDDTTDDEKLTEDETVTAESVDKKTHRVDNSA